jgi:hypothetical protein
MTRTPSILVSWHLAGEHFARRFTDAVLAARFAATLETFAIPCFIEHNC